MREDFRNVEFQVKHCDTYSQWRELGILGNKTKDQLQEFLLQETFILVAQTKIEGMQSITSDIDVQSTTSTTPKEHDEVETLP